MLLKKQFVKERLVLLDLLASMIKPVYCLKTALLFCLFVFIFLLNSGDYDLCLLIGHFSNVSILIRESDCLNDYVDCYRY